MKLEKLMANAVGGAAILVIANSAGGICQG